MVNDQTLQKCSVCRASEIVCLLDMGRMRSRGYYLAENVLIGPIFLACQVEEDDHSFASCTVYQPPRQKHLPVNRLTEFIISATFFVNIFGIAFAWAVWTGSEEASMSVVAMGGVWIATAINVRLPSAGLVMNNSGTVALCMGFVVCYGLGIETSTLGECSIMLLVPRTHSILSRLALKSRRIDRRSSNRDSAIRLDRGCGQNDRLLSSRQRVHPADFSFSRLSYRRRAG